MKIAEEMVERIAEAYADAWSEDINKYLGHAAPNWSAMGLGQRQAMRRVSRVAIEVVAPLIVEECARVVEGMQARGHIYNEARLDAADAIRALAKTQPT